MNYEDRVTKEYVENLLSGTPKIAAGRYIGNGAAIRVIGCGFTPKIAIVWRDGLRMEISNTRVGGAAVSDYSPASVEVADGGFRVVQTGSCPCNTDSVPYVYLALG